MKIFAISDLHLSLGGEKSMDIFGPHWENHWQRIAEDWRSKVQPEDVVLIAGDISWAMQYEEALPDLQAICAMPGTKVMIKGNHDFWHASLQKTRQLLENHTYFIQNDAVELGDFVFAGTRGWKQWQEEDFTPQDEKIYRREAGRLRLSLEQAKKTGRKIIGMSHYPPFLANRGPSVFTQCYGEFGVETVIYGHIHGDFTKFHMEPRIRIENTDYFLTSCDFLNFQLKQIL